MISRTTPRFWRLFDELPNQVQDQASKEFAIWRENPAHPTLHLKLVGKSEPLFSVRVDLRHRAVGLLRNDTITWMWIGSHDDYERLLSR